MALDEIKVGEIAELLKDSEEKAVILIGAGASVSAGIGLAGDFVRLIRETMPNIYKKACEDCGESDPGYQDCMAALTPVKRSQLLRDTIEKAKINWGHIGIARMENGRQLGAILTTNFDPLASRACALFNRFPAVYDLAGLRDEGGRGIGFDKSYVKGSAIFHLHGQHSGFLLLNTEDRLQAQAKRIRPVLDAVMKGAPVIIAGYSGENDPLVDEIAALAPFNHGLFWVCYNDKDPAANVCEKLLALDQCKVVRNMPSDKFFNALADAMGLDAPRFLSSPFDHMLEVLETVRPHSDLGSENSLDLKARAKTRLEAAKAVAVAESPNQPEISELLATGQNQAVLEKFADNPTELSEEERTQVAWAAVGEGAGLYDKAIGKSDEEAQALLASAIAKYGAALSIKPDMYEALTNWGSALLHQAKSLPPAESKHLLKEAIAKYETALEINPDDGLAFDGWGATLAEEARYSQGPDREAILAEAEAKLARAAAIREGAGAYNLACIAGLRGDAGLVAERLRQAKASDPYFPRCDHIAADRDFDFVRDTAEFRQALADIGC